MNELGRSALRAAALAGVRQIRGHLRDVAGGRCAFGVLEAAGGHLSKSLTHFGLASRTLHPCPLCQKSPRREWMLLLHLNDDHGCDFLKLAELMPVTDAGA